MRVRLGKVTVDRSLVQASSSQKGISRVANCSQTFPCEGGSWPLKQGDMSRSLFWMVRLRLTFPARRKDGAARLSTTSGKAAPKVANHWRDGLVCRHSGGCCC